MILPLYFDYMAATPLDPQVLAAIEHSLKTHNLMGNPASEHYYGWQAREHIEDCRGTISELVHADRRSIIFTSGATESNNLAIQGAARFYQRQGRHLITMRSEHQSVLDSFEYLERTGFEVTYLNPQSNGQLDLQQLEEAIRPDTILVSIMHVNNETGVIQDVGAVASMLKARGLLFHVDAAQSVGKIAVDLQTWPIDLMSFSAHKLYGPKGIGALYVRHKPRVRLEPILRGGGHERGLRSGTLPTHQIAGMASACQLLQGDAMARESEHIVKLRDRFWGEISRSLDGIHLNSGQAERIPGCFNIYFEGIEGEVLLRTLSQHLALSTGSACHAAKMTPSHVLLAMGLSPQQAYNSFRISFGRFTTEQAIDMALEHIVGQVKYLRKRY